LTSFFGIKLAYIEFFNKWHKGYQWWVSALICPGLGGIFFIFFGKPKTLGKLGSSRDPRSFGGVDKLSIGFYGWQWCLTPLGATPKTLHTLACNGVDFEDDERGQKAKNPL
jgi:hypothetical protein